MYVFLFLIAAICMAYIVMRASTDNKSTKSNRPIASAKKSEDDVPCPKPTFKDVRKQKCPCGQHSEAFCMNCCTV